MTDSTTTEERFRLIFENSGEAILFAWPDGRIESANPSACRLFGYSVEELRQVGRNAIVDHTDPAFLIAVAERSRTGKFRGELRCLRRDGSDFIAEIITTQFADLHNEIRTIIQFRDITRRKLADAELLQNQQRLEVALTGADLGMWDWHLPSDHHVFDARWAEMLGEKLDQLDTRVSTWSNRVHPDDWPIVDAAWNAYVGGQTALYQVEYRLRHKAGYYIWVSSRGKIIERDEAGQPVRAVGTHLDISLRKAAELQEKEQLHRLQLREDALAAISQGVLITGSDGLITYANKGFEAITGYALADIIGQNCDFLHGPETSWEAVARINKALAAQEPFHGEIYNYRKDGKGFWNGLSIVPVFDDSGHLTQFVGVQRNITTRKLIEEELANFARRTEAMSRQLVAAQEEMRRRLSAELHDRTSPNLAAISINLSLLASTPGPGEQSTSELVEDTRALIEDTAASIREISADLRPPLLDHLGLVPAMESYSLQFTRRTGIKVKINCPALVLSLSKASESILFRIFQEALTNCAKHAKATSLEIVLTFNQSHTMLLISDNGIGFDPSRLSNSDTVNGLGLLNMKEMAEFAGGRLVISSLPENGTSICLELPTEAAESQA